MVNEESHSEALAITRIMKATAKTNRTWKPATSVLRTALPVKRPAGGCTWASVQEAMNIVVVLWVKEVVEDRVALVKASDEANKESLICAMPLKLCTLV